MTVGADRRWTVVALAICQLAFLALLPFGFGQEQLFEHSFLCDFRTFISPTIGSGVSYHLPGIDIKDACYPPVVYNVIGMICGTGAGQGMAMTFGESLLVVSIFTLQIFGIACIVQGGLWRTLSLVAMVVVTPAFLCPLLRANPIGWAFAFLCVFIRWHDSSSARLRLMAALALAISVALKISPCIYAVLWVAYSARRGIEVNWKGIAIAALASTALVLVPFCWQGGCDSALQWLANASANAQFYSRDDPIWGLVPVATRFAGAHPSTGVVDALLSLTRGLAFAFVLIAPFCRRKYLRLLLLGSAMAFLTYHDYGALYLLPAFFVWLTDEPSPFERRFRVMILLAGVSWVVILMPLQISTPLFGTINYGLQGEVHVLLVFVAIADMGWSKLYRKE